MILSDLLKGCELVKDTEGHVVIQTIRNMAIACLTSPHSEDIFANPLEDFTTSNRNYGQLTIDNQSEKPLIVPPQIAVLTKQRAQNHGMVKGAMIPANRSSTFNDAGCIQGSEGGYISRGDQDIRFIPHHMRASLFEKVGQTRGHGNIYESIEQLGRTVRTRTGQYLNRYFEAHDNEIATFIAHFERPENFIGIVVLVDGEIVAIDKFPSYRYANQVWEALIRDCYGSLALASQIEGKTGDKLFTKLSERYPRQQDQSLSSYLRFLNEKRKRTQSETVRDRLSEVMTLNFAEERDHDSNGSYILKTEGYRGQLIRDGEYFHLVTIVKDGSFNPERMRAATRLQRVARNQTAFRI